MAFGINGAAHASPADDANMVRDTDKTKMALFRCVARHLSLVDDGISPPAQIGAAAAQFCQTEVNATAAALERELGTPMLETVRKTVQEGDMFAAIVLMCRASLRRHAQ